MMLLDPENRRELHFYLLLPMSRALLYRILQCEAVAVRICSLLQRGLTVARLVPRSMGKNDRRWKMRRCAKKQSVSCCIPKIGLGCVFFLFSFLVSSSRRRSSLFPDYFDWSFEAWWGRLGEDNLLQLKSTPDCLPWWRCITGRR